MSSLGYCRTCAGPLATRGDVVYCLWCGLPQRDVVPAKAQAAAVALPVSAGLAAAEPAGEFARAGRGRRREG